MWPNEQMKFEMPHSIKLRAISCRTNKIWWRAIQIILNENENVVLG